MKARPVTSFPRAFFLSGADNPVHFLSMAQLSSDTQALPPRDTDLKELDIQIEAKENRTF